MAEVENEDAVRCCAVLCCADVVLCSGELELLASTVRCSTYCTVLISRIQRAAGEVEWRLLNGPRWCACVAENHDVSLIGTGVRGRGPRR